MQRDSPTSEQDEATATATHVDRPPTRARKQAGTMLGRYVILSELGKGGMSVVYVAYDPELDRRVALKVVRGQRLTEVHRARLHREAQALARLSHPSVVTVYDVGDLADDTFVAMELVDGVPLRVWLQTPRRWREVVRVMVAAGRGLAAAHRAGIVHRDVKPDNIVIAPSGIVKVIDFGLARDLGDRSADHDSGSSGEHPETDSGSVRALEAITQHGHVVGTPAYMPPEQRGTGNDADERSDQFSFCVTLYEALFRQRPFEISRKDLIERKAQLTVAEDPTRDTRTLAVPPPKETDVPGWLQRAVIRGLAVEPTQRYASMDTLLAAIDRDPGRTRKRIAVGAAALVTAAGAAALITWKAMPTSHAAASCGTGADRVAAVWSPARRAGLDQIAQQRGVPWAVDGFADGADRYTAAWSTMYQDACQATRVRAEQSSEALDLRMACLDRRLRSLDALAGVLTDADDAGPLKRAGEAIAALPPIADCADVAALRAVVRPPDGVDVDGVEGDLARLTALYAVGDVTRTLALADQVIASARALDYAPPLARALYWRGRAIADREGGPEAEKMYDETFAAAIGAGEDALAADAAARLAQEALWTGRLESFASWQRISHAVAARAGAVDVTLFSDQLDCMAYHWTGKPRTRLACLRGLAARRDELGKPSEWLVTVLGLAATESGELADAIHWLERGVEIARAENGADHPRTLEMRAYLCRGLHELGDHERARAECDDALTRLRRVAPDDVGLIARFELYLATAERSLDHLDIAKPLLERVAQSTDEELALDARAQLGDLAGARGDTAAAVAEHRASLAQTIEIYGPFDPHHPNIIAERHELGVALYDHGDRAAAAQELARADADANVDELSPLEVAQIRFARSRAVGKTDVALARRLAEDALAIYAKSAPATPRFATERAGIEAWLASLRWDPLESTCRHASLSIL